MQGQPHSGTTCGVQNDTPSHVLKIPTGSMSAESFYQTGEPSSQAMTKWVYNFGAGGGTFFSRMAVPCAVIHGSMTDVSPK